MEPTIATRFTRRFGVAHPIVLAPMDIVSGGRLAAAVSRAGGLGLIGGGYGDAAWVERAFEATGNQPVGIGFITWSLMRQPRLLDQVLARRPRALMVSFGDAEAAVDAAKAAGVATIWQVQRLSQAEQALRAGVDAIVVQGQEAGGHGMDRGLTALLPSVRDLAGPDQVILAAGGIADGRGLAAALMLGADGVLVGTRFFASTEADGTDAAKAALVAARGDETVRSKVFDVARDLDWPWEFTGRVAANAFLRSWHDDMAGLKANASRELARYEASDPGDFSVRALIAGEAVDLVQNIEPAGDILHRMVRQAAENLRQASSYLLATQ